MWTSRASAALAAVDRGRDTTSPASKGKAPRTARGEKTLRKILDAALAEFGERGFSRQLDRRDHQPRQGRARHLLHLLRQQGGGVRGAGPRHVGAGARPCRAGASRARPTSSTRERRALASYLRLRASTTRKSTGSSTRPSSSIRRAFGTHYETAAARIAARLEAADGQAGEIARRWRARDRSPTPGRSWA